MEWFSVEERLPEIDYSKPKFNWNIVCLVFDGKQVFEAYFTCNGYAKTEQGKMLIFTSF